MIKQGVFSLIQENKLVLLLIFFEFPLELNWL